MHAIFHRWRAALLACLACLAWPGPLAWGQAALSEAELKAALVFNFARYVEWPERAFATREAPLVICLVGRDRFAAAFTALETRKLHGRAVKVRTGVAAAEGRGCHVAFVTDPTGAQMIPMLRELAGQSVLTVSDAEGFIDNGGAIGIVAGEERLQFEVNRDALGQAQLTASSQLLKLARTVLGKGG